jgi:hypothetical protein
MSVGVRTVAHKFTLETPLPLRGQTVSSPSGMLRFEGLSAAQVGCSLALTDPTLTHCTLRKGVNVSLGDKDGNIAQR